MSHQQKHHEKRPWGEFHVLAEGAGYKVKLLVVDPGGRLSLQCHQHRSEHWTVVKGVATVTVGGSVHVLAPEDSVNIPQREIHRLENDAAEQLVVVEVQFGADLAEDDIIRLSDVYGRERPSAPG